jgi:hypothetical protein
MLVDPEPDGIDTEEPLIDTRRECSGGRDVCNGHYCAPYCPQPDGIDAAKSRIGKNYTYRGFAD